MKRRLSPGGLVPSRLETQAGPERSAACPVAAAAAAGRLGQRGEDIAAAWFEARGWTVVERNWSCRAGELDLIARRDEVVAIVEVRTRGCSQTRGTPAQTVAWRKRRSLERAAGMWIKLAKPHGRVVRFDVFSIDWRRGDAPRIRHYPAAFEPRTLWF